MESFLWNDRIETIFLNYSKNIKKNITNGKYSDVNIINETLQNFIKEWFDSLEKNYQKKLKDNEEELNELTQEELDETRKDFFYESKSEAVEDVLNLFEWAFYCDGDTIDNLFETLEDYCFFDNFLKIKQKTE